MAKLVGLLACLLAAARPGFSQTLYLKQAAVVAGPVLRLGDVAEVVAGEAAVQSRLLQLELGPTPRALTLLPVRALREALAASLQAQVSLVGGRVAVIPAAGLSREEISFYRGLLRFLEASEPDKEGRIEVEVLLPPRLPSDSSAGQPSFEFKRVKKVQSRLAGEVEISYLLAGSLEPAGKLLLRIQHFLPAARAKTRLEAGQGLTAECIEFVEQDISLFGGDLLLLGDAFQGYQAASAIEAGRPLTLGQLKRNLAVRSGDPVTIFFLKQGLTVSLPGRALGSGAIGEQVEVRPLESGKRFRSRISASREVQVELP